MFSFKWGEESTFSQEKVFVFYKSCPLALANLSDVRVHS